MPEPAKQSVRQSVTNLMRKIFQDAIESAKGKGECADEHGIIDAQITSALNSEEVESEALLRETLHALARNVTKSCIKTTNVSSAIQKASSQGVLALNDSRIMDSLIEDEGEIWTTELATFPVLFRQMKRWNNNMAKQQTAHTNNVNWFQQIMDSEMPNNPKLTYGEVFGEK